MDYLQSLINQAKLRLLAVLGVNSLVIIGAWYLFDKVLKLDTIFVAVSLFVIAFLSSLLLSSAAANYLMQPLKALWQAVRQLTQSKGQAATKPEAISFGQDLVANLNSQIFEVIAQSQKAIEEARLSSTKLGNNFIAQNLPLPLLVLDDADSIKFANEAAGAYIGIGPTDMLAKNIYMVLDMSFPSEDTFESWLKDAKANAARSSRTWERVRLNVRDNHPARYFDLAAYYNRSNPEHNQTMLVIFDHSKQYAQEDQAVSFMALSVHELRTPLTLLRGYIEVFEEELAGVTTDPELSSFMLKMRAQAEQLMAYVNNILNVARVDDDQLELRLQSEDWISVLKKAIEAISIWAKIRGITIKCRFQKGLPPVGIDRLSMAEVVNNLIDNAIKYSGRSKLIRVETYLNQEGLVETIVRDYGVGIPQSVMPNLFTKFYRDHRHRSQVGGTGLGLYLSKAIVNAHGGNLWVKSKEGEGSIFGFSVLPYDKLSEEQRKRGDLQVTRSAHGWIKNHSFFRR